jgi:hypothetical protein
MHFVKICNNFEFYPTFTDRCMIFLEIRKLTMKIHFKNLELFSADRKKGSGQNHQLVKGEKNSVHRLNNKKGSPIMAKHE